MFKVHDVLNFCKSIQDICIIQTFKGQELVPLWIFVEVQMGTIWHHWDGDVLIGKYLFLIIQIF